MVSLGAFFCVTKSRVCLNDMYICVLVAFSYFNVMDKKILVKYSIAFGIIKKVVLAIFIYFSTI